MANEETKEELEIQKESRDVAYETADALEKVRLIVKRTSIDFRDINTHLKTTIFNSKEISKRFSTVEKLNRAITKDSKVYAAVQKQIDKDMQALTTKLRRRGKDEKEIQKTTSNIKEELQYQLDKIAKENELLRKKKALWFDVDKAIDSIGESLRHPSSIMDGMISSASNFPVKLWEAAKNEGIGLGTALKEKVKSGLDGILQTGKMLFSPTGLLIAGVTAAVGVVALLWKGMKSYWDFLNERVIPAQTDFNKQLGATGRQAEMLKQQSISLGNRFVEMGLSFEEGSKSVRDFAEGMRTVNFSKEALNTGVKLISVLGLSGQAAGKLALQFQKADGNLKGLDETLNISSKTAEKYGLNASQIMRDMAESPDILARFGTANRLKFKEATIVANQYGVSIKDINKSFGKTMDTFEGTSETAAKLNAAFGTNINSLELMLETDPTKRFEMVRKALVDQGKAWNKLNTFEKNVITSTLQLSEEEAALLLTQGKGTKALQRYNAEKEKNAKTDSIWNRGIGVLKRNIVNLQEGFDKIMRSVGMFAMKLFNIPTESKQLMSWGSSLNKVMASIADTIAGFDPSPIMDLKGAFMKLPEVIGKVPELLDKSAKFIADISNKLEHFSNTAVGKYLFGESKPKEVDMESIPRMSLVPVVPPPQQSIQLKQEIEKSKPKKAAIDTPNIKAALASTSRPDTLQVNLYMDSKKIAEQLVRLGVT